MDSLNLKRLLNMVLKIQKLPKWLIRIKSIFFIKRVEEIFNQLIHEGKIKLLESHTILVTDQFKESKYWKLHESWRHDINSCVVFRNKIQKSLEASCIRFLELKIKTHNNSFLKVTIKMATKLEGLLSNGGL
jgi:hypothetical protein